MAETAHTGVWTSRPGMMGIPKPKMNSKDPWSRIKVLGFGDGCYDLTIAERKVTGDSSYSEWGPISYSSVRELVGGLAGIREQIYSVLEEPDLQIPEPDRGMIGGLIRRLKEEAKANKKE